MPIVADSHIHAVSPDRRRYPVHPRLVQVPGATRTWWEEAPMAAEGWLREFSSNDVESGILIQAFTSYAFDNAYVADSVAAFPASFVGVGIVDDAAPGAAETTRNWVVQRGLRGIRIVAAAKERAQALCATDVWEEATRLGIPLSFLMNFEQLPGLRKLLDNLPAVSVVVEHAAYASAVTGRDSQVPRDFLELARYPSVSTKVTGMNFTALRERGADPIRFMSQIVAAFGPERVMWGSNYPATHDRPYALLVEEGRDICARLSTAAQHAVLSQTAKRIFSRNS